MDGVYAKTLYQGYGLKAYNISRSKTGYICKTDKGLRELKKYNFDEEAVLFEQGLREHVAKNNFKGVFPFEYTNDGLPYCDMEGERYVLEKYMIYEPADMSYTEDAAAAAKTLALFSKATEGYEGNINKSNIGKAYDVYSKRYFEFAKIRRKISRQNSYSPMDLIVIKNFDYISSLALSSLEMLEKGGYKNLCQEAETKKTVCHNMYKGENIRKTISGIYITGISKCAYDNRLTDLAEYIRRYLKYENTSEDSVKKVVEAYENIYPLSTEERNVLQAMVRFPYKFLKIINENYNKRRAYISLAAVDKLEECINIYKRSEKIIAEL